MPLQASTPAIHNAGEFEGRHPAVLTQTHAVGERSETCRQTETSARFGSLLNGGSGGTDPQIRVLPSLAKLATPKFLSFVLMR
jgi:hypothetical protein